MIQRRTTSNNRGGRLPWLKMGLAFTVLAMIALIYLDARVRYRFESKQWQVPARVYAQPLILKPGTHLSPEDLQSELKLLGYQHNADWRRPGRYQRVGDHFLISTRGFDSVSGPIVPLRFSAQFSGNEISDLQDAGGNALKQATLEPLEIGSIYPRHREDRVLVKLDQVPRSLVEILLLIEDRDFYHHFGVSFRAIGRAALANLKAGHTVQGGSTLTQQLVKNIFLTPDRSLWRKAVEAVMAVMVEFHYSKNEILQTYINEVYLGQEGPRSIHGFALASRHYFNLPLADLNPSQIAFLVGLVKGPSYYDPWRHPHRALERRNTVLEVMAEHQMITPRQEQTFASRPLSLAKDNAMVGVYPAYLDLVRRQLRRDYSEAELQTEGMKIYTAFDPIVQLHAERALKSVLSRHEDALEGAMVVTDVNNGDVLAVVGGREMRYAGFNRALDAIRPVGSLVKPAVYLAALQESQKYTLATPISDAPVQVSGADGSLWQPHNFDGKSHGMVLLSQSLAFSYNQATARLGMQVGLSKIMSMLKRLGVSRPLPKVPAILLGAGALSPLDVTEMYQTIASSGMRTPLRSIIDIADSNGVAMAQYPQDRYQAVDKPLMYLMRYALMEVVREGTAKSVYRQLPQSFRVAGKTGTTDDLRDSWFAGFSGDYLAVVWMGRDDNQSAGLTGADGALQAWLAFMKSTSHRSLDFNAPPPGIVYHWIDGKTGLLSREICKNARYMPFLQGSAPTQHAACDANFPKVWQWFKNLF